MNETITITCTHHEINELKKRYPHAEERKTPPYAHWQIKCSDCVITAYTSGKVVFQGENAKLHASAYDQTMCKTTVKQKSVQTLPQQFPQWGSDEVGTGDYFGPVCVCAVHVAKNDVAWLKQCGIQDSKAMKDSDILTVGSTLMERLAHSLLILDNATYNNIHTTNNMVAIKCKLHNQAFVHLSHKTAEKPEQIIVDQFVQEKSYYRYLQKEKDVMRGIHFETKAENKYLAVACASVIARYAFLRAFDAMCEQYQFAFLKGASSQVDKNIVDFVAMHGKAALYHVAKLHFANTKKAAVSL